MAHDHDLSCAEPERRRRLLDSDLDGIDFVQVPWDDQAHVAVYFVKGPPPAVTPAQVRITGGVRITGIRVVAVATATDTNGVDHLEVTVDRAGDFSPYVVHVDRPDVLDRELDHRRFSFKAGCPADFDCLRIPECPPESVAAPAIDYLAKDYASFRRLLLDTVAATVPEWTERHEADLGVTLLELLAYEGDHISYAQDAVANEMHLETARQRESVARHVALVDYRVHQGSNARAFVHVRVDAPGVIPARSLRCPERTVRFLTRMGQPVDPTSRLPPGPEIASQHAGRALAAADGVFEPVEAATLHPALNRIPIHTWGNRECCLPSGSTTADLVGAPPLAPGELLLLEEVRDVTTGSDRHPDTGHRQVVRLTAAATLTDELHTADPGAPGGVAPRAPGTDPLVVTRVSWDPLDALGFPLCVSTIVDDGRHVEGVAVARGNVVLVDHGATVEERHVPDRRTVHYSGIGYRFRLGQGPLTHGFGRDFVPGGPVRALGELGPAEVEPHVVVVDGDGAGFTWLPEPTLLDAGPFSRSFVAEPDHRGRALLRFGDGALGRAPSFPERDEEQEENRLRVILRVGNGRAGNVARDSIAHVLAPEELVAPWPGVAGVTNPLPAWGGTDPEPLDAVRAAAPEAFRALTLRAVTEADYAAAAERLPTVARARADFRWTGSWHTVFTAVDPRGTDELGPDLERAVRTQLTRHKLAGYDLEIDPPTYVALRITIAVCVRPDHFAADVRRAVARALSARTLPDGTRGFFHPDRWTFGQALHVSELYAAVEAVPGVDSAEVVELHRYGRAPDGELARGRVTAARLEILRLDGDPDFPEHGVLELVVHGGK